MTSIISFARLDAVIFATMSNDSFIHACAGGLGGIVAMTATYPLMSISTRAAVESSKHPEEVRSLLLLAFDIRKPFSDTPP